jgi:alpha-beta hydrolase superfamily lysophospholipase
MPGSEFKLESYDGLKLHVQGWEPDMEPKAVVCIVHGLGGHGGRYGHVAEAFTQAGYAMLAMDLRGHGKSEGRRGHAKDYAVLTDDIFQMIEAARERYPDLPVFLYGHSLGGNLVIHYALRRLPKIAGIIAMAPLLRTAVQPPAWKLRFLKAMYSVWPTLTISNSINTASLSRDENVVQVYLNDPLIHDRVSARLGVDMLKYGTRNIKRASEIPCPILLMHGTADRVTSAKASQKFASRAGRACTLKLWDGLSHELHNEPEYREVLDFALVWMAEIINSSQEEPGNIQGNPQINADAPPS